MKNFNLAFKVLRQLGWRQGFLYIAYQFLLRSGILRYLTPSKKNSFSSPISAIPLHINSTDFKSNLQGNEAQLLDEADKIVEGQITIFGEIQQTISFSQPKDIKHWSQHRAVWLDGQDIKLFWEVGRFAWATTLARAYQLKQDEKYAQSFWRYFETFLETNPTNCGLHWSSAQEVALRLICLSFCYSVFVASEHSTEARKKLFSQTIAAHAERIPPTLLYARAQNNNHLITEALGLYTAAAFLPKHPKAKKWRKLGWRWLNHAFQTQINTDGRYIQNSNNYHRLMLQCALWTKKIADIHGDVLPDKTTTALVAATQHLYLCLDETSGQVPNLGPNDGAYILPLSLSPFNDYRPVLQAAGQAFLGHNYFPSGVWDEMSAWLVIQTNPGKPKSDNKEISRLTSKNSWASLRAVQHTNRPGHADQLHVELWWHGLNIAQDAGSYLYNAPSPWQNALSGTDVHNTITINDQDQMFKASRFLYLDWAQAKITKCTKVQITAEHDGYKKQGIIHQRNIELLAEDHWKITDEIINVTKKGFNARLHWLLPDWSWNIEKNSLRLNSPHGPVILEIKSESGFDLSLVRAGKLLYGEGEFPPHRGWVSPNYAVKKPALSFAIRINAKTQLNLTSIWKFPNKLRKGN